MRVTIVKERPDSEEARAIISELEADLDRGYPPESQHGYSVEKLVTQGVDFFLIRVEDRVAGCGGVQFYDEEYGELKRMYVRPPFRGNGLARQLIERLIKHARENRVALLRLETGIYQEEAIRLYEGMGFREIPPFGDYRPDPLSLFYELAIPPGHPSGL